MHRSILKERSTPALSTTVSACGSFESICARFLMSDLLASFFGRRCFSQLQPLTGVEQRLLMKLLLALTTPVATMLKSLTKKGPRCHGVGCLLLDLVIARLQVKFQFELPGFDFLGLATN
jgi:hypothetical protein